MLGAQHETIPLTAPDTFAQQQHLYRSMSTYRLTTPPAHRRVRPHRIYARVQAKEYAYEHQKEEQIGQKYKNRLVNM